MLPSEMTRAASNYNPPAIATINTVSISDKAKAEHISDIPSTHDTKDNSKNVKGKVYL